MPRHDRALGQPALPVDDRRERRSPIACRTPQHETLSRSCQSAASPLTRPVLGSATAYRSVPLARRVWHIRATLQVVTTLCRGDALLPAGGQGPVAGGRHCAATSLGRRTCVGMRGGEV